MFLHAMYGIQYITGDEIGADISRPHESAEVALPIPNQYRGASCRLPRFDIADTVAQHE
jgi:hypothetical protein